MYGIDVKMPGMKIATVAACPVFGGKLAPFDDSTAIAITGVRQVVRLDDAVAVVGDHMWAAKQGLAALDIEWDEGPNAELLGCEHRCGKWQAAARRSGVARNDGDVSRCVPRQTRSRPSTNCHSWRTPTMEPINCTGPCTPGRVRHLGRNRVPARAQASAAQVTRPAAGEGPGAQSSDRGGFGRRLDIDVITQAVAVAKQVDRPVKVVWSREEDIQHDVYRPYYYDRLTAGLDEQDRPVAWHHRVTAPSILARWAPPAFVNGLDTDAVEGAAKELPYSIPNVLVDYVRDEPPGLTTGWWRGVGPTHNIFVVESFVDELAAAAKKDPVEYRRALLGKSPRALAVLKLAAEKAGWGKPLPDGIGRGVSLFSLLSEAIFPKSPRSRCRRMAR